MLFSLYLDIVKSSLKKISKFEICLENAFSACEAEFSLKKRVLESENSNFLEFNVSYVTKPSQLEEARDII